MFFISSSYTSLFSQNPRDSLETVGFAKFLYTEELYKFAAEEYERLSYFFPHEIDHQVSLISAYRKAGLYDRIKAKISSFETDNPKILSQYLIAMILNDDEEGAREILNNKVNLIDVTSYNRLILDVEVVGNHWKKAQEVYNSFDINDAAYHQIISEGVSLKKKSPALAGVMSSLIPGTGRMYANDYKDGLISIAFIGLTAYQSYLRFNKNGIKSPGGWIYGGLSFGFYVANIVGSVQSAKIFNRNKNKTLHAKAKNYIDRFYLD